uniref:non-specific serine/threonine protein kinase n=1 Tax=Gouania willdenowi TaxID=441366 RepID=A0A8C5E7H2_GOUWI
MEREILGRGTFGDVFEAVRLSDFKLVAIKHIPRGLAANTSVYGQGDSEILEVLLMQRAAGKRGIDSLPNPAIIGFEDVLVLEDEVLIIMENPVDAMSLYDFITSSTRPMLEHEVKSIIKQVLNAAIIMHHNGVLHNDIRTENILVSINDEGPSVKIIDFGCAELISDTLDDSSIGLSSILFLVYTSLNLLFSSNNSIKFILFCFFKISYSGFCLLTCLEIKIINETLTYIIYLFDSRFDRFLFPFLLF